jgi:hypothetical protein
MPEYAIDIEYAERLIRKWLPEIGLSLVRSGKKPGTNEPAYRIMSTSRLNMGEICAFALNFCDGARDEFTKKARKVDD